MKNPITLHRVFVSGYRKLTARTITAAVVIAVLAIVAAAATDIFQVFRDDDGKLQSLPAFAGLDGTNPFFTPSPQNGQSCATCHVPSDGFTIHVQTIQDRFNATGGLDPLFALNDAANKPDPTQNLSSLGTRKSAFSLALKLGVFRIGEVMPANAEFVIEPQDTVQFGPLPNLNDPQHPGLPTFSFFRRPLVDTNMRFDSAVLWNGRASITNIAGQVTGASKTLLLIPTPDPVAVNAIARFQLGVFTDQIVDDRSSIPQSFAGDTSAAGAQGGTQNLLTRSVDPAAPCLFDKSGAKTTSQTPAVTYYPDQGPNVLTPSGCTPVQQGGPNMTTFAAWANVTGSDIQDLSRRQIAHGEEIFNNANLNVPPDIVIPGLSGNVAHCTTCHATPNIGNHPDATFLVRLGSDSVDILQKLAQGHPEEPNLQDFVKRTRMLPQYCLRSTKAGAPTLDQQKCGHFHGSGSIPGDTVTSDPGLAMTTGKWADIGKFKPPILRGLAPRSPYFHGSAADSTVSIVDFYNARFEIGLTQSEKDDLVRFLEAH